VGYSPNSKAYHLYHPSTHCLFKSFHVKFIEWKDDVSHPLFLGCIIDIPSTVDPNDTVSTTTPSSSPIPLLTSQISPSLPKHTCVPDEEESITSGPSPVWENKTEVPFPLHNNPANVVPVLADGLVPVPEDVDPAPCCSACHYAPSTKVAETLGIQHVPRIAQAVVDSRKAGHRLKEQHAQAKFK